MYNLIKVRETDHQSHRCRHPCHGAALITVMRIITILIMTLSLQYIQPVYCNSWLPNQIIKRHVPGRNLQQSSSMYSRGGGESSVPSPNPAAATTTTLEYKPLEVPVGSTPLDTLILTLKTHTTEGLSSIDASQRLIQYGFNKLTETKGKSILELIFEQLDDKLVQILLAVAALSGFFSFMEVLEDGTFTLSSALIQLLFLNSTLWKHFMEPLVILAILIVNATVGVWQSRSAEGSMEALKKLQPSLATVLRDGIWMDGIDASTLVPGDIISFRVGDKIPADARVLTLQTSSLRVDEGTLTGESTTVEKLVGDEGLCTTSQAPIQDMKSLLFAGTLVTAGTGTALVVRTGMDTEMGKIQKGVSDAKLEEQKTPLAQKLDEFGETLTKIIGVICLAIWGLSIPKWKDPTFTHPFEGAVYYAKVAVALGVAAIPGK